LLINQWCNVVRWETEATKLFLRSREFLWQEGHCVYATAEELETETLAYLHLYKKFAEEYLAVPVIAGKKTDKEKFAGAVATYSIEGFMPDGKALQCGTSHNLGQNFAKSFNIKFLGKDGKEHLAWQNSWGISTRLIGALVMSHSDNKGLILPPNIAPYQIVIVPILFENTKQKVLDECKKLKQQLKDFSVMLDDRDEYTPGWKFNEWEMKGVPLRIEIGPKDIEKSQAVVVRRDNGKKEFVKLTDLQNKAKELLAEIQDSLFKKAKKFLDESIVDVKSWEELEKGIRDRKLVRANFCGEAECEEWIKSKTEGASSRNIPFDSKPAGKCVHCGKKAKVQIYFSRAY
jgi:prolyl-tRNA synthetase